MLRQAVRIKRMKRENVKFEKYRKGQRKGNNHQI